MKVTQISVFLENRPGRLLSLLQVFAAAGVNLQRCPWRTRPTSASCASSWTTGPAPCVPCRPPASPRATTEVLRVEIPDEPGGLAERVVAPLAEAGVNVEYVYAYSERRRDSAVVVLKVDDLDKAERALGQ